MNEITITNSNFEEEVIKSDKPVLVDFWATWCGPCKMLSPELEKFSDEHPEIKIGKINVDEESELSIRFKVASIPMLALFKDGQLVKKDVGYMPKDEIEKMLL